MAVPELPSYRYTRPASVGEEPGSSPKAPTTKSSVPSPLMSGTLETVAPKLPPSSTFGDAKVLSKAPVAPLKT